MNGFNKNKPPLLGITLAMALNAALAAQGKTESAEIWPDFGEEQPTQAGARSTRMRVGSSNKEALERELNAAKLQLQNCQQIRLLMSTTFWSLRGPISIAEAPLKVATEFSDKYKGQSLHKAGSPHVHVWRSLLKTVTAALAAKDPANKDANTQLVLQTLQDHMKSFEAAGPKKGHMFVKQCRIKRCREEALAIISYQSSQLLTNRSEFDSALHLGLITLGFEVLEGTAPPNDMERKAQRYVEDIKAQLAALG